MKRNIAVRCVNICKRYPIYKGDIERLKKLFIPKYKPEQFTALSNINIELKKEEVVGLIGLNGSGKSTLSSIITGITYPSEGTIEVNGEVNMLAANSGLDPQLTGIENIDYKCLLMGMSKKQTNSIKQSIIDFADIGIHINQPLRTYSSGMRSRLGFAISVNMDPDILIIDEALSVGDNSFTDKCLSKIDEFKKKGKTILFVTHSVTQMNDFCDRVIWLNRGVVVGDEIPERIIMPYCGFAREFNAMTHEERNSFCPVLKDYQEKYL